MNAENLAGGFSVTPSLCAQLFASGIDVMTSGNHIFDKKEAIPYIAKQPRLIRPANYPPNTPGNGIWNGVIQTTPVAVINLMGRVFMPPSDDPFRAADRILESLPPETKVRIVDMHAEATSEKVAMGWYLDGRVSAVLGTHTHVQTADGKLLRCDWNEQGGCDCTFYLRDREESRALYGTSAHLRGGTRHRRSHRPRKRDQEAQPRA